MQHTRPLLQNDLAAAVSLSAAAFQNTSSYAAIVPDDDARQQFLAWLFERNYQFALEHGVARVVEDDGEIIGFYLFERPNTPTPTLLVLVRWGFLGFPFRFGVGATARLLRLKSWFEAKEREIVGDRKIAKLERVTVLPARQGRGVAGGRDHLVVRRRGLRAERRAARVGPRVQTLAKPLPRAVQGHAELLPPRGPVGPVARRAVEERHRLLRAVLVDLVDREAVLDGAVGRVVDFGQAPSRGVVVVRGVLRRDVVVVALFRVVGGFGVDLARGRVPGAPDRRRGAGDDPPVAFGRDGGPARYDGARQDV